MTRRAFIWLPIALILLSLSPAASALTSSCSAECDLCPGSAPTCDASCSGRNAHCQDGNCGGRNVGCCCGTGSDAFCLDTPCGSGQPGGGYTPKAGDHGGWVVLHSTPEGTEALYASSSAFAESILETDGNPTTTMTRFVFVPQGRAVGLEPKRQAHFLKGIRQDLTTQLQELKSSLNADSSEIFGIEVDRHRANILFTSNPSLSDTLRYSLVNHTLSEKAQLDVRDPVDVFFVEVRGDQPSIFHVQYDRKP